MSRSTMKSMTTCYMIQLLRIFSGVPVGATLLVSGFGSTAWGQSQAVDTTGSSRVLTIHLTAPEAFYAGAKPELRLTIINKGNLDVPVPDGPVHVECDGHEPPTTLLQRQWTHTLRLGEPDVMPTGFRPTLPANDDFIVTYQLSPFYDLTKLGHCTAFVDINDSYSNQNSVQRLRSNVVHFDMKPDEAEPLTKSAK